MLIYYPEKDKIIAVNQGTGDQLIDEDYDEGYTGYFNYTEYNYEASEYELEEADGGLILYKEENFEKYKNLDPEDQKVAIILDYFGDYGKETIIDRRIY